MLTGVFSYTMHYHGYGFNMSTRYLRDYCPGAQFVMKAGLPNFHVEFRRYSEDLRGGISTIMEAPSLWSLRACSNPRCFHVISYTRLGASGDNS
jgi:hypothetical protein